MRVLVLFAHPVETSFVSALHRAAVDTLRGRGHDVDDCDLNAEGFDPVLSRDDRITYHDKSRNQARVRSHVERLEAAEGLVLVHPVWNFGFPAILKGFFDRVFLPGVSFDLDPSGNLAFRLGRIRRLACVCTYGASRWQALLAGDPPRAFFFRVLRPQVARNAACRYLAHYDMNHTRPERRERFTESVRTAFERW